MVDAIRRRLRVVQSLFSLIDTFVPANSVFIILTAVVPLLHLQHFQATNKCK